MNIRDCKQIHANLIGMMHTGFSIEGLRPSNSDAAYAWTRLLCRQLRSLTVKRIGEAYDWV